MATFIRADDIKIKVKTLKGVRPASVYSKLAFT
jgi:hypothetical protein